MLNIGKDTSLEVNPDYSELDLVVNSRGLYVSITLEPEHVAALISLLKAALPGLEKAAIVGRRIKVANKATPGDYDRLTNDDEYMSKEHES